VGMGVVKGFHGVVRLAWVGPGRPLAGRGVVRLGMTRQDGAWTLRGDGFRGAAWSDAGLLGQVMTRLGGVGLGVTRRDPVRQAKAGTPRGEPFEARMAGQASACQGWAGPGKARRGGVRQGKAWTLTGEVFKARPSETGPGGTWQERDPARHGTTRPGGARCGKSWTLRGEVFRAGTGTVGPGRTCSGSAGLAKAGTLWGEFSGPDWPWCGCSGSGRAWLGKPRTLRGDRSWPGIGAAWPGSTGHTPAGLGKARTLTGDGFRDGAGHDAARLGLARQLVARLGTLRVSLSGRALDGHGVARSGEARPGLAWVTPRKSSEEGHDRARSGAVQRGWARPGLAWI
jgi:hypothetical protein